MKVQASSMPTFSTLPVRLCLRSLMKVSVMALTRGDAAVEPQGGVDAMGEQVAGDAAAGGGHVQPPESRPALRQVRVDGPVLEELGAVVEDLAQPALVDQLLGQGDGGHAAIVVPDHVRHAGLLDGLHHLEPFGAVHGQRLFAQDHLAGRRRGQGDFGVGVVRRADVDHVDVLALDELAPVGFDRFVAPGGRRTP